MNIVEELFKDCYLLKFQPIEDNRGLFVKTFQDKWFATDDLKFSRLTEEFYTVSKNNVIRGMHFQVPPYEQNKIVYCSQGEVLDVLVDLRKSSSTYKCVKDVALSSSNFNCVFIPPGIAHGYLVKSEMAHVNYKVDNDFSPEHDQGILWSSIDFNWRLDGLPILSEKDKNLVTLKNFRTPFE